MIFFRHGDPDLNDNLRAFASRGGVADAAKLREGVESILADVRTRGDAAIIEHTARIDGVQLTPETFRVPQEKLKAAADSLDEETRTAIRDAIRSVRAFHERGLPKGWDAQNLHSATVGEIFYPLDRVGLWIPGGSVPLVSTVIMTAVPARLARVPSIAAFTPPSKTGEMSQGLLAAFQLCGVEEVYAIGGVTAIGAMAYGTSTIAPACKIFGPGNAFVAEAKRQVIGSVGIDLIAGPSEVMIIADKSAKPAYIAADLIAQAEHGSGAEKVYLVTIAAPGLADAVQAELDRQLPQRLHKDTISRVLGGGYAVIDCDNFEQAGEVANFMAPEHLELHTEDLTQAMLLRLIRTAGAIFLGDETPTVLGDFAAGPNHTLPTARTGRFYSGLQTIDFMRRSSLVRYDGKSLEKAAHIVRAFARLEQLDGHGESLEVRLRKE